MSLSNTLIKELKTILKEEFSRDCDDAEAAEIGTSLVHLADTLQEISNNHDQPNIKL